jgi:transposase
MKPTYDELFALVQALSKQCFDYQQTIKRLEKRIADLEDQLNKNSKNSSKPPSSDPKPNLPPKQKKEKRPFHLGASRQLLPQSLVTMQTERQVDTCPRCRSKMAPTGEIIKWQQIELPEIKPQVHQWNLHVCQCPNCHLVATPRLEESEKYVLGPRLEALVNLCLSRFKMGHSVVREFIATLLPAVSLSQGLISKVKLRASNALASSKQQLIRKILSENGPLHADATSWRHNGVNEHTIVMRVHNWVVFSFVPHQNKATFKRLLPKAKLHLVTDRGLAVSEVGARLHQYCLSHLLRNLKGIAEHPKTTIDEAQKIGEIHEAIRLLFIDKHRMQRGEISLNTWRQYGYQTWLFIEGLVEEILSNRPTQKVQRFFHKMQKGYKHFKVYLRCPDFPMTNNLAEESLRSLVIARKLCFGSRSEYGKSWRASIQSCIETLHRHKRSILDFLSNAVRAYRNGSPCPDICSEPTAYATP